MIYTSFHIPPTYGDVITRSFNLIVSAGVRAGRKYGEYNLKKNKGKKMKATLGN